MIPKVDTFEHDISEEIRRKEASLQEISTASNDVGNSSDDIPLPKKPPILLIASIFFICLCVAGFGVLGYFYYTDTVTKRVVSQTKKSSDGKVKNSTLEKVSPTLATNIGRFVSSVEKKEQGYILTINDYAQVFAYMARNENSYIEELASQFPAKSQQKQTTAPSTATTTQVASTSATTTTLKTATSTATTSAVTPPSQSSPQALPEAVVAPEFTDVTVSNQNMRVWRSSNHTVVYAFISNKAVAVSDSQEGILYLKSAILK